MKIASLKIYDYLLSLILNTTNNFRIKLSAYKGYIHCKLRMKERFGLEYNRTVEDTFLKQIRSGKGKRRLYGKSTFTGDPIYKLKYRQKDIFVLYFKRGGVKRIGTVLTKEMVEGGLL